MQKGDRRLDGRVCPNVLATFLLLLRDTAMRSGEGIRLKRKDVDLERCLITCNEPKKGSDPRILSELKGKPSGMVDVLPRTKEHVFGTKTLGSLKATYVQARKRLAFQLQNPRLNEIHLPTL
jgi:integrase